MTRAQAASLGASDLPPLPPDWRYEPVSALGQPDEQAVLTGPFGTNLGRGDFVEQGVPVLTIGCLTEGGINADKALYVSEEKARELDRYQLREGDLLFSRMASVGRAGIVPKSLAGALLNYHIMRLRLDESRIDPRAFINYVRGAKQVRDYLKAVNHGATRDGINTEQLLGLPVAVPPPAVQREMVAEFEKQFSRLDEAVANLKRVQAGLVRYKAATLAEAFDVQPTWSVSSYSAVGVVTTGFTPPTANAANFGGAIPFFKPTDLDAGEHVVAAREYLSDLGLSKGRLLPANSVLVTCIGATIGKTGLARVKCATNQQINAVSPDPATVDARFLYWWTVSPRGQEQIVSNASATTLPILNKSKFSALAVPLPPLVEQRRIVAEVDRHLSIVREVEAEVDANLKRAQALRQGVLAKAFRIP